jgi:SAM-dependent MidA family methyltransferase
VIVDLSMSLKESQAKTLSKFAQQVSWVQELPSEFEGVVVGNEVLDAMPIKLMHRLRGQWSERGVALRTGSPDSPFIFCFEDRPSSFAGAPLPSGAHEYLTEIHPQAQAFVHTLADRLKKGAVFLIDYGFPEHEYYHPERCQGTLMCHRAHRSDPNPLVDVGLKDITAHVNFSDIALSAQGAGMNVLGYTSQAHFLINSGLLNLAQDAIPQDKAMVQKLIVEHEMGELFKVIALGVGQPWEPMGFVNGDRTHTL